MKYRNVHTGEVEDWTPEIVPGGRTIMVSESGTRWAFAGTPGTMMTMLDLEGNPKTELVKTPSFLSYHEPVQ